jgi:ribonuclease G
MAKNILVINVDIRETRIALIENGIIAEFHIERASEQRCLGDVVLGRVTRVLPGMQAAFIDVGLEKAAFLHVEDLIRPDDFEAYLTGAKRIEREEANIGASDVPEHTEPPPPADPITAAHAAGIQGDPPPSAEPPHPHPSPTEQPPQAAPLEPLQNREAADPREPREGSDARDANGNARDANGNARDANGKDANGKEGGGRRRRRRRGPKEPEKAPEPPQKKQALPQGKGKRGDGKGELSRIDKHTPIREVVREGQEVLVQISKEPIGTKGARVTSHISLPGRYVVFLPTVEYIGVSKRIGSEKERSRLREAIEGMKPPTGGIIIRTLAEGLTKKQLKADVGYLVRLWGEIVKKREGARSPTPLFKELDLTLKVARDMFGDDVAKIVIDDRAQYERLVRFVEMFMPERVKDIELYTGDEPIFDAYGIEEEIARALSRKVPLPSGGYLIIDEAEALTAIDVNTGRFVGKGSKDHEETIIKTNLEAVEEIAYQLRFRNLGGLIVLDLIDMERASSREQVRRKLEDLLQKDKAKTSLNRISDLGLIEMTRKRTRESLGRLLHEPCFYCDGTGQVRSKTTVVYEILRAIRRERASLPGYTIVVQAHPDVIQLMKGEEREAVQECERRFTRRIDLTPRKEYHLEQFDLVGR